MIEYLFSPEAHEHNQANQAIDALRELRSQVVIEEVVEVKNQVDAQTYQATAEDFQNTATPRKTMAKPSKSRENMDGDPEKPLTQNQVEQIVKDAHRLVDTLKKLDTPGTTIPDLEDKLKAHNLTLDSLTEMKDKIYRCSDWYGKWKSNAWNDINRAEAGTPGISLDVAKREYANAEKKENETFELGSYIGKLIEKIKTYRQKKAMEEELEAAKANGVVTDYTKVAENPKLAETLNKMKITFQKDEDGVVKVYVNGEYTNFALFDPEECESYEIFPDVQNIGVLFVIKSKDDSVFQGKLILKGDKVYEYYKSGNETEWESDGVTFKLSN